VRGIEPNSPAAKAGLREGDIILEFNGEAVVGVQQLTRLVRETPVGRTVQLRVRRDNMDQTFQVTAETNTGRIIGLPNAEVLRDRILQNIPRVQVHVDTSFTQSGVRVQQLTDQLRDYFGVFSNAGVLVGAVESRSAGERAGLQAGDVIISVNGRMIRSPNEFNRELRAASSPAALKIIRDKQERDISLEVGTR
jgi:serine protease Do